MVSKPGELLPNSLAVPMMAPEFAYGLTERCPDGRADFSIAAI
jgi:hypothetical protein